MRARSHRTFLGLLSLVLLYPLPGRAETPAEVQQRLEQYRHFDAEAAQRRAKQEAEAEQRREQTRQWQEQRRREEYARRWKRYGDEEIDVLQWRQQKDGTWVTTSKKAVEALPEPQEAARVRFGDNLVKIAQRYNLTLAELLRLNPGLEAARLVVGTQIRTAQSNPSSGRMLLGLKPSVSSGLSLPNPAQLGAAPPPQRFDQSLDELVGYGIISPG